MPRLHCNPHKRRSPFRPSHVLPHARLEAMPTLDDPMASGHMLLDDCGEVGVVREGRRQQRMLAPHAGSLGPPAQAPITRGHKRKRFCQQGMRVTI